MKRKRKLIKKFKPYLFVDDVGTIVLMIWCENCGAPVAIANPLCSFYESKEPNEIWFEICCHWCEECNYYEVAKENYQEFQKNVESLSEMSK